MATLHTPPGLTGPGRVDDSWQWGCLVALVGGLALAGLAWYGLWWLAVLAVRTAMGG